MQDRLQLPALGPGCTPNSAPSVTAHTTEPHSERAASGHFQCTSPPACPLNLTATRVRRVCDINKHTPQNSRSRYEKEKFQFGQVFHQATQYPLQICFGSTHHLNFSTQNVNYLQFTSTVFGVVWIKLKILSQSSCSLLITDCSKKNFLLHISSSKGSYPSEAWNKRKAALGSLSIFKYLFSLWLMTILLSFSKFYFLKKLCAVSNLK